jgi:uncharacterized protein YoxC
MDIIKEVSSIISPVLIAIIGWFVVRTLKNIETRLDEQDKKINILESGSPYQRKETCSLHHQNITVMFNQLKESINNLYKKLDKYQDKLL